ncbi:hypothetical protein JIG36_20110 [Actinoplanes sp. LDG1-06]|uniref:Lipoprotein n=1 Tax=Paractinoplanes ovalisporus TaxID=2810368 RepID=A0ABS2ADG0_9ACTN|nr:hypothetical protein [Actinoplanes ovalisporus]MBM2617865.1 hypothetical protein [Actinoplanes ovalisporus]
MRTRAVALVLVVSLVGGCDWAGGDGRDRNPENRPGYVLGEHQGTSHRIRGDGDVSSFQLFGGADVVRVRLGDLGGDLYELSTPDDSKVAPTAAIEGIDLVAGLRDTGRGGPAVLDVVLSDDVRWQVRLAGGAQDETVDLSGGRGGDVNFSAGTARASVVLPAADGTQKVTLGGGASLLSVRVAGQAPVRVSARGGAGSVTINGETHTGVAGGSSWVQDGWDGAAARYDVDATSGVGTMTVEHF